eukprot:390612-Amphidinium_carterae.2
MPGVVCLLTCNTAQLKSEQSVQKEFAYLRTMSLLLGARAVCEERIDLTQFSYTQIPEMLRSKGFRMQGEY